MTGKARPSRRPGRALADGTPADPAATSPGSQGTPLSGTRGALTLLPKMLLHHHLAEVGFLTLSPGSLLIQPAGGP